MLHTKLDISFNWELRHLLGEAQLSLRPYFYATKNLLLDAKGFEIHEISIIKNGKKRDFSETRFNIKLLHNSRYLIKLIFKD